MRRERCLFCIDLAIAWFPQNLLRGLLFPFLGSHNNFVAILDLPEGEHQYKFFVDGQWTHDPSEVLPEPA